MNKFFKVLTFLIIFLLGLGAIINFIYPTELSEESREEYKARIIEIEQKYNIDIDYENPPRSAYPGSKYEVLEVEDEKALAKYVQIFHEEFMKYPADFIQASGLKKVVFVKKLSVDGVFRAAEPDASNEVLFYDILLGRAELYNRAVVHHEFYHMVEEEINGNFYYKDPEWLLLNDPEFNYGLGGADAYGKGLDVFSINNDLEGFMTLYSTYGLEEDKAVTFATLFVPERAEKAYALAEEDKIISDKISFMKAFLAEHSTEFNADFWQEV